jgi:uncharacterized protein YrzB (UPF0473 family)
MSLENLLRRELSMKKIVRSEPKKEQVTVAEKGVVARLNAKLFETDRLAEHYRDQVLYYSGRIIALEKQIELLKTEVQTQKARVEGAESRMAISEKYNERWNSVENIFQNVIARAVEAEIIQRMFNQATNENKELKAINRDLVQENQDLKAERNKT